MIENFYTRVRNIIEKVYESDTEYPLDDTWDALEKEFNTDKEKIVFLQYHICDYEPEDIAWECLELGKNHKIIQHTEIILNDWDNMFFVALIEK